MPAAVPAPTGFARSGSAVPDFGPFLPSKRPQASLQTTKLHGELGLSAVPLTILAAECRPGAVERAMSEVEFDRIVDAVRKEIAIVPAMHSFSGLRAFDGRVKAAGDKPASPRHAPLARIRRVGEGRKRYR
jgi:hypothetical protein